MPDHHKRTEATETRIRDMIDAGIGLGRIAQVIGISVQTMWDHYEDILDGWDEPGRPKFEPTEQQRNQVKLMAALGITKEDMATNLGIHTKKLNQFFGEEMRVGRLQANVQVAGNLFKMATGNPESKTTAIAAIWWSKAQMGWRDTTRIENTGADGGPIKTENQIQIILPDNGRGDGPEPVLGIELDQPQIAHEPVENDGSSE